MPLPVRVKAVSLSTATNWAFNWVVGEGTPMLQERLRWRLYPFHGFFCCASFILVYFFYPETMGIPLEEMDDIFKDAGMPDDIEERAPLRVSVGNGGDVRAPTDPPQLTEEDYRNGPRLVDKIFGPPIGAAKNDKGDRPESSRTSSNERNYRSLDQ